MVVFNLFFFTILLPLITSAVLARHSRRPFGAWFTTLVMAAGVSGFSVLAAPWGWFGVPVRFVVAAVFLIALIVSLRRGSVEADAAQSTPIRALVKVVVGVFFGGVAIGVLRAHSVPPGAIDVAFPLTRGSYIVGQGGSHSAANYHAQHPVQRYALDIAKLNRAGLRARGIYPNDARAYAIFGATVVSPCDGTVVVAADAFPDAARISLDEKNPAGNHVIVRCGDVNITLAHLQRGSVAVRTGATIARGAPIGRVGNSGNSTEPHLHVHGERNGAGVPLRFDGQWLVRNTIVRR